MFFCKFFTPLIERAASTMIKKIIELICKFSGKKKLRTIAKIVKYIEPLIVWIHNLEKVFVLTFVKR